MVLKATHLIISLSSNIIKESTVCWIGCASKHKVLPNKYPPAVSLLIETLIFVNTATPYAQHIHLGKLYIIKEFAESLVRTLSQDIISGNIVCALSKQGLFIDLKIKTRALVVGLSHKFNLSDTDLLRLLVKDTFMCIVKEYYL